jgi:hypothetical protein
MFKQILGPSPLLWGVKKLHMHLFFNGSSQNNDVCLSDEAFLKLMTEPSDADPNKNRPHRMSTREVRELLSTKAKLTREQRLVKSLLEEANLSRTISDKGLENVQDMYEFRRKYKRYLRFKRFIPLTLVAPFTTTELSKMAYAAALESKSISLTLPGFIGYSLPAFFFFHMSSFYVPDKIKPVCQFCKYTVGAPFWAVGYLTDKLLSNPEERYFGEVVPIDIVDTDVTIFEDLKNSDQFRKRLKLNNIDIEVLRAKKEFFNTFSSM